MKAPRHPEERHQRTADDGGLDVSVSSPSDGMGFLFMFCIGSLLIFKCCAWGDGARQNAEHQALHYLSVTHQSAPSSVYCTVRRGDGPALNDFNCEIHHANGTVSGLRCDGDPLATNDGCVSQ